MPRYMNMQELFVKKQTSANTFAWGDGTPPTAVAPTLFADDIVDTYDADQPDIPNENIERKAYRSSFSNMKQVAGPRRFNMGFRADMRVGDVTSIITPLYANTATLGKVIETADLVSCAASTLDGKITGFTGTGRTMVVYKPTNRNTNLLSACHLVDGSLYTGYNLKFGLSLKMIAKQIALFEFKGQGQWNAYFTGVTAIDTSASTTMGHLCGSAYQFVVRIAATDHNVDAENVEIDWAPDVAMRTGHKGRYGEKEGKITGRKPNIKVDLESGTDALDTAVVGAMEAQTLIEMWYFTHNPDAANGFGWYAKGVLDAVPPKDADGELRHDITMKCQTNDEDDEFYMFWY